MFPKILKIPTYINQRYDSGSSHITVFFIELSYTSNLYNDTTFFSRIVWFVINIVGFLFSECALRLLRLLNLQT